jgi:hypothetical protein
MGRTFKRTNAPRTVEAIAPTICAIVSGISLSVQFAGQGQRQAPRLARPYRGDARRLQPQPGVAARPVAARAHG